MPANLSPNPEDYRIKGAWGRGSCPTHNPGGPIAPRACVAARLTSVSASKQSSTGR